jgi:hypothetical protein
MTAGALVAVIVLAVTAAVVWRPSLKRRRWRRQLQAAACEVEVAMADGRIAAETGEALLQHLDGLHRACSDGREN